MAGSFGYELDLGLLSEDEKQAVSEQIKRFKKYGSLIHNGSYYRLTNPMEDNLALWEFVSEDKKEVLVHGMICHTEPNMLRYRLVLRGLDESGRYKLDGDDSIYSGKALMSGGILLPRNTGDYFAVEMHLLKCEE
jgi:alpha-galactosidase